MISIVAGLLAGSVALLAFGIDSGVESASGLAMLWRLRAERAAPDRHAIERLELRARRLVAASLFLLAAYVGFESVRSLLTAERPETSAVGIGMTIASLAVMPWLARAKRRAARALGSRALEADAFQTTACFWLSLFALAGLLLNATLGWWWADPAAAIVMIGPILWEARASWRGDACAC